MEGVRKFLITQETDFSADLKLNILEFLQEKLILLLHFITAIFTYPFEKIGEILLLLKSNILEFLQEKLTPLFHWIAVILTCLSEKIDEIFPPETREETLQRWLHIALTVSLPALVAGFVLYLCCPTVCAVVRAVYRLVYCCCRFFCRCCFRAFRVVCRCCSRVLYKVGSCCCCCSGCLRLGRFAGKIMKAPGRAGALMPRASFEANPRLYFINLRARNPLVY